MGERRATVAAFDGIDCGSIFDEQTGDLQGAAVHRDMQRREALRIGHIGRHAQIQQGSGDVGAVSLDGREHRLLLPASARVNRQR
jgi:hypothetical protein